MPGDWNFLAGRLIGDGTVEITESDLPITVRSLDTRLSAPSSMSSVIPYELTRLKGNNGRPILEPNNTVLLAEAGGNLKAMQIYTDPTFNGPEWILESVGLSAYPLGKIYDGEISFVGTDPLDIYRHFWTHLQTQRYGDLGVSVDTTKSPVRIGTLTKDTPAGSDPADSVSFDAGPRQYNWWSTPDIGAEIDKLARETPFDWLEEVLWLGDQPTCTINLGYPTISSSPARHRLILDENVLSIPSVGQDQFVTEVHVLGNGEGRDRIRSMAIIADERVRNTKVIQDESIKTRADANARARLELLASRGGFMADTIQVTEHKNFPLDSIELGMEVPLVAETDHIFVDTRVRIVGKSETPGQTDTVTLQVVRVGLP